MESKVRGREVREAGNSRAIYGHDGTEVGEVSEGAWSHNVGLGRRCEGDAGKKTARKCVWCGWL